MKLLNTKNPERKLISFLNKQIREACSGFVGETKLTKILLQDAANKILEQNIRINSIISPLTYKTISTDKYEEIATNHGYSMGYHISTKCLICGGSCEEDDCQQTE